MMLRVCVVSAYITDAVVHTGMFAPCNILAVGAVPRMGVFVVSIRSVGMRAVKASPPAKSACVSFSYVGFHVTQVSHTVMASFDMTLAANRIVIRIFVFAIIRIFDATRHAFVVSIVTVRFTSGNFCFAVHAPSGVPVGT